MGRVVPAQSIYFCAYNVLRAVPRWAGPFINRIVPCRATLFENNLDPTRPISPPQSVPCPCRIMPLPIWTLEWQKKLKKIYE